MANCFSGNNLEIVSTKEDIHPNLKNETEGEYKKIHVKLAENIETSLQQLEEAYFKKKPSIEIEQSIERNLAVMQETLCRRGAELEKEASGIVFPSNSGGQRQAYGEKLLDQVGLTKQYERLKEKFESLKKKDFLISGIPESLNQGPSNQSALNYQNKSTLVVSQDTMLKEQENKLNILRESILRQKEAGGAIGKEIDKQIKMISEISDDTNYVSRALEHNEPLLNNEKKSLFHKYFNFKTLVLIILAQLVIIYILLRY